MQNLPLTERIQYFDAVALKLWFKAVKRELPWRDDPSAYRVWVSEIMLQQTQVSVVREYFLRWMRRFPTIEALAKAPIEEVIKLWEGLGYYQRARNLHQGAKYVMEKFGGKLPNSTEELAKIKGIGPYTRGAILSLAFHKKAAAVDGNVIRVLTRFFAIADDILKTSTQKRIWEIAEKILPEEEPWIVVEGLIELGATVCKKIPLCHNCPLQQSCAAFESKEQIVFPIKKKKIQTTYLKRRVFVFVFQRSLLIKKVEPGQLMAGLYEFPYSDLENGSLSFVLPARKAIDLTPIMQFYTRYRVHLNPEIWIVENFEEILGHEWIPWEEIENYPFSSGHKKILNTLKCQAIFQPI